MAVFRFRLARVLRVRGAQERLARSEWTDARRAAGRAPLMA